MCACYSNPSPTFLPKRACISSISNANPAVVTTISDHNYVSGEIVRLVIPQEYGMQQANNLTGTITITGSTTFNIDIDTTLFDLYAAPVPLPSAYTSGQVIPVGEVASTLAGATKNVLPSGVR